MADSKKHIRICRFCKSEHRYCFCEEYKHLEPWHLAYCSANCMETDGILSDYGAGIINAEEAYEKLKDKDVSRKEFWGESFRNTYDEILEKVGKKTATAKAVEAVEESKIDEEADEPKISKKTTIKQAVKKTTKAKA